MSVAHRRTIPRMSHHHPLFIAPLFIGLVGSTLLFGCDKDKTEEKAQPSSEAEKKAAGQKSATQKKEPPSTGLSADEMKMPSLPEMPIPKDNPQSDAKIELGHRLFFDKRMSGDGKLACYSCHQNENGTGGGKKTAVGAHGKKLPRHSPIMWNVGYLPRLYWDGRADSLEAQAKGAWGGGNLGVGKDQLDAKAKEIARLPEYKPLFEKAFPDEEISANLVAQALAAYERTLVCDDTAYDKYAAGNQDALTKKQKVGLTIFMGKGMCSACHAPPHFSTAYLGAGAFFNVGVGIEGVPEDEVDVGRMKVTGEEKDWAAFKPPTLRNVTQSAPYFHDGSAATLKEAVTFMASGGYDNKNKSPLLTDKKLTNEEIEAIIAFLGALECGGQLTKPAQL